MAMAKLVSNSTVLAFAVRDLLANQPSMFAKVCCDSCSCAFLDVCSGAPLDVASVLVSSFGKVRV